MAFSSSCFSAGMTELSSSESWLSDALLKKNNYHTSRYQNKYAE